MEAYFKYFYNEEAKEFAIDIEPVTIHTLTQKIIKKYAPDGK